MAIDPEKKKKKKKVIVKVAKKTEDKVVITGDEYPGLSKEAVKKMNEISDFNKKKLNIESLAKNDSIAGANKAKLAGQDIVDQRRAGSAAGNIVRAKEGSPQVLRGREYTGSSYPGGDKYSKGFNNTVDSYTRNAPLEKEFPDAAKYMVKVKKK